MTQNEPFLSVRYFSQADVTENLGTATPQYWRGQMAFESDPLDQFPGPSLQEARDSERRFIRYNDRGQHWKRECSSGKKGVTQGSNPGSTKPRLTMLEFLKAQRFFRAALSCLQSLLGI